MTWIVYSGAGPIIEGLGYFIFSIYRRAGAGIRPGREFDTG